MILSLELIIELILSFGLYLITIPLHEYGHKFAYRVLGYDADIIWRDRRNKYWWSIGASCGVDNFWGTSLDHAFVDGSGGAVQAAVFLIPMFFFESFGFFTITCIVCLGYMFYEIIAGHLAAEWAIDYQEEEIINERKYEEES